MIVSFDIGKKNFAFCIEEYDDKELRQVPHPKKTHNQDGTCTEEMNNALEKVFANGKVILYKNTDLTEHTKSAKGKGVDVKVFHNLTKLLDEHADYWERCQHVVVEKQMAFGKKLNLVAIKLAQHVMSYFYIKYPGKKVVEFPAYHKTQVLGAPKTEKKGKWLAMDKPARKKWSVEKAIEILTCRGDMDILDTLTTAKKRDDLADTLTQLQAYKYLYSSSSE